MAAFLLGCAGRRGDRGGEAGGLEVDRRHGDFSPRFWAADGGLWFGIDLRLGEKESKREGEAAAWGFYRGG
jgi:hypothetical protein